MLAGLLSAGVLVGVPAIAQNSSSSPQAPAPTYPEADSAPDLTEPESPESPAVSDPVMEPDTETTTPGAASETEVPETSAETEVPETSTETASMTITDMVAENGSFATLKQALQAAELTETLSEEGPYTVFAPTDAAFAELPNGALEFLLQPENQAMLQEVLTYHVASEALPSSEISTGLVQTLGGGLAVRADDDGVVVNNASVIQADVQASNGVIHVINRVLLPETVQQALADELGVESIY